MTARFAWLCAAAVAAALVLHDGAGRVSVHAQGAGGCSEIRVLPLRGNVYVLTGAVANFFLLVGNE